ncbi:hypothetical protein BH10BAC2_BH10BAC2_48750 [soil metagenome]
MTMTQTTIQKQLKKDLSHVDNLADLLEEKKRVKARLKTHEQALGAQWKKLPAESFKLAVRKVLPFYLNNKVLDKSWGLLSGAVGLFGGGDKTNVKKNVLGTAKKLGLFTAIRAGYNLWKKK